MSQINYFTEEGLKKLKEEVEFLERVERPRISKQIGEAIDKGDLSENAEYDAAKEEQGLMEARLAKLKNQLANARLIDDSKIDASKALILSTVTIKNVKNGMEIAYTLVAEKEADLKKKRISINSPIGKGLLGKTVGDIAEITTPGGKMEFEIINITR
ncbi:MAG: transcription elongation factor GreA [Flavobacteriales bacterium]|jgi:transcription elongation factor GreA|nr:transcription elongation factor GreA [Flavobacteriales bacterium]